MVENFDLLDFRFASCLRWHSCLTGLSDSARDSKNRERDQSMIECFSRFALWYELSAFILYSGTLYFMKDQQIWDPNFNQKLDHTLCPAQSPEPKLLPSLFTWISIFLRLKDKDFFAFYCLALKPCISLCLKPANFVELNIAILSPPTSQDWRLFASRE